MTIDVRPATLADARGIAEVHVRAWQEAYAHLVPADDLARLSIDQREVRWRELISASTPDVWVATDEDAIVGWATSSIGHAATTPRDRELEGLYISAVRYGTGVGQALIDAAVGKSPAFLWVADDNPRARAFYARNGFRPDGTTKIDAIAGTDILVARLVR